jgi:hypothetical protein
MPTCLPAYLLPTCLPTYLPSYLPTCLHAYLPTTRVDYTERRKEEKENVPSQNSLGSASRRTSTERRKTKKNLLFMNKNTKK